MDSPPAHETSEELALLFKPAHGQDPRHRLCWDRWEVVQQSATALVLSARKKSW